MNGGRGTETDRCKLEGNTNFRQSALSQTVCNEAVWSEGREEKHSLGTESLRHFQVYEEGDTLENPS